MTGSRAYAVWRRLAGTAAVGALLLGAVCARASSTPVSPFPGFNGQVYAAAVSGDTLYVGGAFTPNGVAAVDLLTGTVNPTWNSAIESAKAVKAMALSSDGRRLYLAGDFTQVNGEPRNGLAAVDLTLGTLNAWTPALCSGATVNALALSPDGRTLYAGGDFSCGGHIAAVSTVTGDALPWTPAADAAVRALAISEDGATVYAGGDFSLIGGQARARLAALNTVNGKATTWNPGMGGAASTSVNALVLSGSTLYAGGAFTAVGTATRRNLAAVDVDSGAAKAFDPDVTDGRVDVLALTADGRLYAGGSFTQVNGTVVRNHLAGFDTARDTGNVLPWNPSPDGTGVSALALDQARELLTAGGSFASIGSNLAAFSVAAPTTVTDPTPGGYKTLGEVVLTCTDNSGAGCDQIYYTTDGSDPTTPAGAGPIHVPIVAIRTTIKYFSEDFDGNREAVNTGVYAVDTAAPSTDVSLPGGLYGFDTLEDVTLTCQDDTQDLGCATYYTLDGSAPTTASSRYTKPISLGDLFPPPGVAPDEVDPLKDLAGTVVLRYFSVDTAANAEGIQSQTYQVDLAAPAVTASLPDGNYVAPQTVTLSCDDGSGFGCKAMYYTTDDTIPSDGTVTDDSGALVPQTARYTGPITLTGGTILRALAVDNAGNKSSTIDGAYARIYSFTVDSGDKRNSVGAWDPALLAGMALLVAVRRFGGRTKD